MNRLQKKGFYQAGEIISATSDDMFRKKEKVKPTEATSPVLDELKAIEIDKLAGEKGVDPTEDFTTYTEVDHESDFSITSS